MSDEPTIPELKRRRASVTKFVTDPKEEKFLKKKIIPNLHKSE